MQRSNAVTVEISLAKLRENVREIARQTGVDIYAVVKADGYGFGAARVAEAIKDLVHGYYCFNIEEAIAADLWKRTGKPTLALVAPGAQPNVEDYLAHHIRPGVTSIEQATALKKARPILSIDTGMQRFAVTEREIDAAIEAGAIDEAFTHGTRLEHALELQRMTRHHKLKLHAAGTALLDEPRAWLDAVRPGLAIYRGIARVTAPIVEARDSTGPAGYTGFLVPRHGVILAGYSNGVRVGPAMVNGRRTRLLEVGMQSAFVELSPQDKAGDVVTLLGDGITESEIASVWGCGAHEVCVRMGEMGNRKYKED